MKVHGDFQKIEKKILDKAIYTPVGTNSRLFFQYLHEHVNLSTYHKKDFACQDFR